MINSPHTKDFIVSKKLNELFDEARQRNLKEDFEVGQAAQALFELKKSAKLFNDFLNGPFTEGFKKIHNDPRNIEQLASQLIKQLESQKAELSSVVDEVTSYLTDQDMYVNPESSSKDQQRDPNRWSRWENRTPRHIRKQEDREDDGF